MSDTNPSSTADATTGDDSGATGGGFAAVDAAAGGSAAPSSGDAGGDQAGAADAGGGQQDDAGSRLRASLNKIADRAEEIRNWGAGRQDAARDLVEARPLTVVGAALGIGLLLGLVASRV